MKCRCGREYDRFDDITTPDGDIAFGENRDEEWDASERCYFCYLQFLYGIYGGLMEPAFFVGDEMVQ